MTFSGSDFRKRLTLIERIRSYLRHASRYIHVAERHTDSKSIALYSGQALGQSNALEFSAIPESRYAYLDHAVGHVDARQLAAIIKRIVSQLDYTAVVRYNAVFTAQYQSTIDRIYQTVPVAAIDTVPILHGYGFRRQQAVGERIWIYTDNARRYIDSRQGITAVVSPFVYKFGRCRYIARNNAFVRRFYEQHARLVLVSQIFNVIADGVFEVGAGKRGIAYFRHTARDRYGRKRIA